MLQGEHSAILLTFILLPLRSLFCLYLSGRFTRILLYVLMATESYIKIPTIPCTEGTSIQEEEKKSYHRKYMYIKLLETTLSNNSECMWKGVKFGRIPLRSEFTLFTRGHHGNCFIGGNPSGTFVYSTSITKLLYCAEVILSGICLIH